MLKVPPPFPGSPTSYQIQATAMDGVESPCLAPEGLQDRFPSVAFGAALGISLFSLMRKRGGVAGHFRSHLPSSMGGGVMAFPFVPRSLPSAGDLDNPPLPNPRARKDKHTREQPVHPPAKEKPAHVPNYRRREGPKRLNGSNGSKTNTDDVVTDGVYLSCSFLQLCSLPSHQHRRAKAGGKPLPPAARRFLEAQRKNGSVPRPPPYEQCPLPTIACERAATEHFHFFAHDEKKDERVTLPTIPTELAAGQEIKMEHSKILAKEPAVPPKGESSVSIVPSSTVKEVSRPVTAPSVAEEVQPVRENDPLPVPKEEKKPAIVEPSVPVAEAKEATPDCKETRDYCAIDGCSGFAADCEHGKKPLAPLAMHIIPTPADVKAELRAPPPSSVPFCEPLSVHLLPAPTDAKVELKVPPPSPTVAPHVCADAEVLHPPMHIGEWLEDPRSTDKQFDEWYVEHNQSERTRRIRRAFRAWVRKCKRADTRALIENGLKPHPVEGEKPRGSPPIDATPNLEVKGEHATREVLLYYKTGIAASYGGFLRFKRWLRSGIPWIQNVQRVRANNASSVDRSGDQWVWPMVDEGYVFSLNKRRLEYLEPYSLDKSDATSIFLIGQGYDSCAKALIFDELLVYLRSWDSQEGANLQRRNPGKRSNKHGNIELNTGFVDAVHALLSRYSKIGELSVSQNEIVQNTVLFYVQQRLIEYARAMTALPVETGVSFGRAGRR